MNHMEILEEQAHDVEHEIGNVTVMVGVYQGAKVFQIVLDALIEADKHGYQRAVRDCSDKYGEP